MFQDILAAIPLGIIMAFMFGPVFFVLLETAAIKGARVAVVFDIGVILADFIFLLIAYFSTNQLLKSIKDEPGLFIFGGCLLATYAVISILQEKKSIKRPKQKGIRNFKRKDWFSHFAKGFLLNFVNIGVLGFWLGLIIAFGPAMEMQTSRLALFFGTILLTYFAVDILKILLAKKLTCKLTPSRIFRLKRTINVLILLCGILLIARGVFPKPMKKVQNQVETVLPDVRELQ